MEWDVEKQFQTEFEKDVEVAKWELSGTRVTIHVLGMAALGVVTFGAMFLASVVLAFVYGIGALWVLLCLAAFWGLAVASAICMLFTMIDLLARDAVGKVEEQMRPWVKTLAHWMGVKHGRS